MECRRKEVICGRIHRIELYVASSGKIIFDAFFVRVNEGICSSRLLSRMLHNYS